MQNEPGSTRLYLVRHGQAVSNIEPIIAGMKGDAGLTQLGVQQARCLHDRLASWGKISTDVFLASSLPRARQTAEIIAPALGLPFVLDDEVQELRPGPEGDGLSLDEYRRRFGWVAFKTEPSRPVAPGGESWATFAVRVSRALHRITSEHRGKTIVVVCHGGVIDASVLHFFGMPLNRVPAAGLHTHNTSITCWAKMPGSESPWRLVRCNDDAHLRDLEQGREMDWTAMEAAPAPEEKPSVPLPTEPGAGRMAIV